MREHSFELRGANADETRLLVHPCGFRAGIPGHPALHPGSDIAPVSDVRLVLGDKPIEITYRLDRIPNQLEMEALAVSLATAYAGQRSVANTRVRPSRNEELCEGAEAGARAIYNVRGPDSSMEWLSVLVQSIAPREVYALYQVVAFQRDDLNAVQFASLRTAMVAAQRWDEEAVEDLDVWPPSAFVKPSVSLELTDAAWETAQTNAAAIGAVDDDAIATVTGLLIGFANTEQHPSRHVPKYLLDAVAERIASNLDTVVSVVLLRNLYNVITMHDLRGWCWQALWALGNRAGLAR